MYSPSLTDLVGDEREFMRQHFGRKPLLRKGGLPVDPAELLSIGDIDRLLATDSVRLPYVRVARGGSSVREAGYTRERVVQNETVTDAIDQERVHDLFRSGATVTWNSLNHVLPHLRVMTDALGDRFATRSDVIAFLTPAGRQGYAPHHDPVDVFVIQLYGAKEWQVWETPEVRLADTGHYEMDELGSPRIRVVLEPGDVMYLPFGTPHVAASRDSMSLHLSVAIQHRQWREHLASVVRHLVDDDPRFWTVPDLADAGRSAATLGELAVAVADALGRLDPVAEVERLATVGASEERDSRPTTMFSDLARLDVLDAGSRLRLSPHCTVDRGGARDGRTELRVSPTHSRARVPTAHTSASAGSVWVPETVAAVVVGLGPDDIVSPAELYPGVDPDRAVAAARALCRGGVLELEPR